MADIHDLKLQIPLKPVRSKYTGCKHTHITVVEDKRHLVCQGCNRVLDPFDYLMDAANNQQRIIWNIEHGKHELEQLQNELDDLKRQKRNLKASIRRLNK